MSWLASVIKALLLLVVMAVIILFSIDNRGSVPIDLWPLPQDLELPLFAIVIGAVFFGAVVGYAFNWLTSWSVRARAGQAQRRLKAIEARERVKEDEAEREAVRQAAAKRKAKQDAQKGQTVVRPAAGPALPGAASTAPGLMAPASSRAVAVTGGSRG